MNELTVRQEITPMTWHMLAGIAESSATGQIERQKVVRHLLFCFENQLPLSLAVNGGLYTVNGRVEVEGTVIRAQIRKHPHYDYTIDRLDDTGCTMTITYDGELLGSVTFDSNDAKQAKLTTKDNWQNYAPDMYLARATSRAYKRYCPDIFFQSVYVRGEINGSVIIDQPTIQSLTDQYGPEKVLEAAQQTAGDIDAMIEWLEAQ